MSASECQNVSVRAIITRSAWSRHTLDTRLPPGWRQQMRPAIRHLSKHSLIQSKPDRNHLGNDLHGPLQRRTPLIHHRGPFRCKGRGNDGRGVELGEGCRGGTGAYAPEVAPLCVGGCGDDGSVFGGVLEYMHRRCALCFSCTLHVNEISAWAICACQMSHTICTLRHPSSIPHESIPNSPDQTHI